MCHIIVNNMLKVREAASPKSQAPAPALHPAPPQPPHFRERAPSAANKVHDTCEHSSTRVLKGDAIWEEKQGFGTRGSKDFG